MRSTAPAGNWPLPPDSDFSDTRAAPASKCSTVSAALGQTDSVTTFGRAGRFSKGYDAAEVDEFFEFARRDYEEPAPTMTTAEVRRVTFTLIQGGYDTRDVDAALDRLEDALASRERSSRISEVGERQFLEELTGSGRNLQGRLGRPAGERFRRAVGTDLSYDIDQVDALCDELRQYFSGAVAMSPDEVRRAAFAPRRGPEGYREVDVDVFLQRVVEVMAIVD